ncbi:lysophospholipid acyltransferase family protein [Prauserella alba]|uniref:lysophospholipid acyltransferase family protein n=1 Tax=Prauserella alba TaxID=176898 RepID=UPI0020A4C2AD|nr:lysophospholipid acyltransferase family protein [Prauserella alba]
MESVRRTVALAKVLTGALPDTDHHPDTEQRRVADVRHRAAAALDALGITLTATGPLTTALQHEPPNPQHGPRNPQHGGVGTLVVANHVSWLDVPALLALEPLTFLAKREVAHWPFVGRQARRTGTLLLDRWSLRGLPTAVDAVAERLRAGESVVAFPEATTWCGAPGGPFRRAVFQAAIDAGAPVRPVTLSYRQRGEPSTVAAFVGDDGLASSLPRVIRARELTIHAECHRPIEPAGDRRALAARAQRAVQGSAKPQHEPPNPQHGHPNSQHGPRNAQHGIDRRRGPARLGTGAAHV